MAAFRECYGKLYELRSLASDVPVIALTATATRLTRDTILNILHMECFVEIKEVRTKPTSGMLFIVWTKRLNIKNALLGSLIH